MKKNERRRFTVTMALGIVATMVLGVCGELMRLVLVLGRESEIG